MKPTVYFALFLILNAITGCDNSSYPILPGNADAGYLALDTRPLTIGSETYIGDFATISVPENRSNPSSRMISIPFLRIHAKVRSSLEPIFALTGGPGNSNLSWDLTIATHFLSDRDFVMVGYRGADGSSILDCPEVTNTIRGDDSKDLLGEESLKKIGQAWTAAGRRLTSEGVDLNGYTILECIEDHESVRIALGYDRINLLSKSYGTRVAYLYSLTHPQKIFRSAMIAVNPPGHFVWDSEVTNRQLRYYSSLWAKDSITSKQSPDLYKTMETVLSNMPQKWLFVSIDPGKVRVVTFVLLFHRDTAVKVFDAYIRAEKGDPSGLAMMSVMYDYVMPSMITWGDLASKGIGVDFDPTRNYNSEMEPSSSLPLGSPMGKLLWGSLAYAQWPVAPLQEKFRKAQLSEVETLLLSGNIDFSTPAEHATNELLPYLRKGKQIIFSEAGHSDDILKRNSDISLPILAEFFHDGNDNLPISKYIPMNFEIGVGFPQVAKMILAAILVITGIGIATIIVMVKKYRRNASPGLRAD